MLRWSIVGAIGAIAIAAPLGAQSMDVAPAPPPTGSIAAAPAPVPAPDSSVDGFYASHPGTLLWLRDADTRGAASRLAALLKDAALDGVDNGAELASAVEAAATGGLPENDKVISAAFVRLVQALKGPVTGVSYGDPALALKAPSAELILTRAAAAPSLAAYVDEAAGMNPFYAALRSAAIKQGDASDPHVRATLERLRLVPAKGRAILVDVANAELMMLDGGQVTDSMKVIVGKAIAPTPLLAGTIHYVTFNPYWHIPQDVARRKVAPIVLKRGTAYLKAAKYQTVAAFGGDREEPVDPDSIDWKAVADGSVEANIRQLAGPNNMMGAMKFGFVNDYGIFLHDTPHKDLFAKAKRNLSLGCVRVEHPERLAEWLLGREPDPPGDGSEQLVGLDRGVPIYILYLTARPDGEAIAFADDVYKLDGAQDPSSGVATASAKR